MKVYSIEEIREALADRVLTVVAEKTKIHPETLYNITRRKKGMSFATYEKLVAYLFGATA